MKTIKELRLLKCWTQKEVMKKIGMESRSNFSKIENRKQKPRFATRRKLAEIFSVEVSEIEF